MMHFFRKALYYTAHNDAKSLKRELFLFILVLLLSLTGCQRQEGPLVIGAAASLTNAMEAVGDAFTNETGIEVEMSYASSGALKQQILDGAPVDVFISASISKMDQLMEAQKVEQPSVLFSNRMVFVVQADASESIKRPKDLIGTQSQLAMGEPESVPAGMYAKEVLIHEGVWENLQQQLVLGKNVRQVADYLNLGEVDCGFIYQTDVGILGNEVVVHVIPESAHTAIQYPAAVVKDSQRKTDAIAFKDFLLSETAKAIFESYGFQSETE